MKKKGLLVVLAVGLLSLAVPIMVAAKGGQSPAQAPRTNEGTIMNSDSALFGAQRGGWLTGGISMVDAVAVLTGMEVADVVAELQSGKTYADLAKAQSIVDVMLAARSEALAQAVADGRFTQEQADTMLAQMATDLMDQVNAPWMAQGVGNSTQFDGTQPLDGSGFRGNGAQDKGNGRTDRPMLIFEDCPYDQP